MTELPTSNLVIHLRTALERIAKHANHQPPSGLTTDHLVGYWQGRAEGICLEARAALENLPVETSAPTTPMLAVFWREVIKAAESMGLKKGMGLDVSLGWDVIEAARHATRSSVESAANLGANIRHDGGIAICGWCGFALITNEPRQCCPQGQAYDAASTFRASENGKD